MFSDFQDDLKKVGEILDAIGFPKKQNTELTRIAILALLDREPKQGLLKGKNCLHAGARITDILNKFANEVFQKKYAENTRETIRKNSLKPLQEYGLISVNKDNPTRPTNSGNTNYTINKNFEILIKSYDTPDFDKLKSNFYDEIEINKMRYIDTLKKVSIKINIPNSKTVIFSPGNHNIIQKFIVEELVFLSSSDPHIVYMGDTGNKEKILDMAIADLIDLKIDIKAKIPDVIAYDENEKKVLIYEAVANCGPIDSNRKKEIEELFSSCHFRYEFYSVFLDSSTFQKYSPTIAAGTTVYVIDKNIKINYSTYKLQKN